MNETRMSRVGLRAVIARWFTHYAQRRLEWLLALYTVWFGGMLCLPPLSMSSASFEGALSLMSETSWGVTYVVVGLIHNVALHVNGRAAWTPFARLCALTLNANVFLAMCLSLIPVNPVGTGVLTYGFVAVGFCGAAIWGAAQDCGRELKIWRRSKNAGR